jgi:hypothetical protein
VAIGQACGEASREADACSLEGGAWRGSCAPSATGLRCQQTCRPDARDCGSSQFQCYYGLSDRLDLGICVDRTGCADGGMAFSTCASCLEAATGAGGCCEGHAKACQVGTSCSALRACVTECDTETCVERCLGEFPNGAPDFARWFTCLVGDERQGFAGACGQWCGQ